MAESTSESADVQEAPTANAASVLKQMESQMVSLNFVLKNTQSEVIKLQKALARYQNRQDELEKKLEQLEREQAQSRNNQKADNIFRSRFMFYQVFTAVVAVLISVIIYGTVLAPKTTAPAPAPPAATEPPSP